MDFGKLGLREGDFIQLCLEAISSQNSTIGRMLVDDSSWMKPPQIPMFNYKVKFVKESLAGKDTSEFEQVFVCDLQWQQVVCDPTEDYQLEPLFVASVAKTVSEILNVSLIFTQTPRLSSQHTHTILERYHGGILSSGS